MAARLPVLIASGQHNQALEAVADRLATAVGARRETVPGRGHLVPRAAGFSNRLERFLEDAERRDG